MIEKSSLPRTLNECWTATRPLKIFTIDLFNKNFLPVEFIPANESKWFIAIFKWYTWLLFRRRFHRVWIQQEYQPQEGDRTVYYLNHHSWWDGLIPLLLNEFRFRQRARALMEDRQMKHYRFFRKIGAFSINRNDPRKTITSLRYAVHSMQRKNASLFVYPEGKITPPGTTPEFEGGLGWLHENLSGAGIAFVPIGIHIHTMRSDKPELHLAIGTPTSPDEHLTNEEKTAYFENSMQQLLNRLIEAAGFEDSRFERLM
ncbi:MAG: lysophospholipid acyltransferase family protein [Balneolaceae bacterium]|nr:lysophospholipid acyltransferase family protein [Balneolaceae bacterium]